MRVAGSRRGLRQVRVLLAASLERKFVIACHKRALHRTYAGRRPSPTPALEQRVGAMSEPGEQLIMTGEQDADSQRSAMAEAVGRHRLHRFPARRHAVKVLYGDDELAVVQRAAAAAGLRPASYVAAAALASATGGRLPHGAGQDREALSELLHVRLAVHQYGVNLNQVAAALNSGGQAPGWLERAVAGGDRALARVDEAARLLARRLV